MEKVRENSLLGQKEGSFESKKKETSDRRTVSFNILLSLRRRLNCPYDLI